MASKAKAKAIVAVRRRKKREQDEKDAVAARESLLESRLLKTLGQHIPKDGKAGRDAPTLSEIVDKIAPLLPKPEIHQTTVVQEVKDPTHKDVFKLEMEEFVKGLLPDIQPEDRPAVEQITIDVSDEKLEGFVSQEEMKKHLQKIQDAIFANQSGGGGGSGGDLVNVIQVTETTTITSVQLLSDKYNVILVMTAGITITLPEDNGTKVIEIKQGFTGTGTYTICKE